MKIKKVATPPKIKIDHDYDGLTPQHYFVRSKENTQLFLIHKGTDGKIDKFDWINGHIGACAVTITEFEFLQKHIQNIEPVNAHKLIRQKDKQWLKNIRLQKINES